MHAHEARTPHEHDEADRDGVRVRASRERDGDGVGVEGFVWLRRLFTDPTGRDLVALDSKRRRFEGGLARFLQLRDPTCRGPIRWSV